MWPSKLSVALHSVIAPLNGQLDQILVDSSISVNLKIKVQCFIALGQTDLGKMTL